MFAALTACGGKYLLRTGVAAFAVAALCGPAMAQGVPDNECSALIRGGLPTADNLDWVQLSQCTGPAQAAAGVAGTVLKTLNNQVQDAALQGIGGPGQPVPSPISMFMVSGVTRLSHDGFSASSPITANGRTPDFDETDVGLTLGLRMDTSKGFGLAPGTLTFGLFGNYTRTDIDLGTTPDFAALYPKMGSVDVDSWSVGGYSLITDGSKYGLLTVSATFGSPDTKSAINGATAEFNTLGISTSAMLGVIVPAGPAKLDLRGGLTYITVSSDDYVDSANVHFTDGKTEELSGAISARLFGIVPTENGSFRPFIQGGVSQRLHYKNELTVDGTQFSFDDGGTTVFARAGLDFDVSRSLQAYLSVRGDKSEDMEALAAQVGFTFKLD